MAPTYANSALSPRIRLKLFYRAHQLPLLISLGFFLILVVSGIALTASGTLPRLLPSFFPDSFSSTSDTSVSPLSSSPSDPGDSFSGSGSDSASGPRPVSSAASSAASTSSSPSTSGGSGSSGSSPSNTSKASGGSASPTPVPSSPSSTSGSSTSLGGDTDFDLVFQNPNGDPQVYTPPVVPPAQYTWATYVNYIDKYSIAYPSNWQVFKFSESGHEGLSIFPPGVDPAIPESEQIGLGWSAYYSLPKNSLTVAPLVTPILVDGLTGSLYTQGALGESYIAAILPLHGGYFGLACSISTPEFAYAFSYMLSSFQLLP